MDEHLLLISPTVSELVLHSKWLRTTVIGVSCCADSDIELPLVNKLKFSNSLWTPFRKWLQLRGSDFWTSGCIFLKWDRDVRKTEQTATSSCSNYVSLSSNICKNFSFCTNVKLCNNTRSTGYTEETIVLTLCAHPEHSVHGFFCQLRLCFKRL
jgi:hypothetical protein